MTTIETLPELAQQYTDEQVEALIVWHMNLPLSELRSRQKVHNSQIKMAHKQGKHDVLVSEQMKADLVTDAVSRKVFGIPLPGSHTRRV